VHRKNEFQCLFIAEWLLRGFQRRRRSSVVRMSVFGWRTFPAVVRRPRCTCTTDDHFVCKLSAICGSQL